MAKRKGLDTLGVAAKAKKAADDTGPTDMMTTAMHIRRDHWKLLRIVAHKRAIESGGRASVSALITELVERHRKELEEEAGPLLQ